MTERSRDMLLRELDKMVPGLSSLEKERFLLAHDVYTNLGPEAASFADALIRSENIDPTAESFDAEAFVERIRTRA